MPHALTPPMATMTDRVDAADGEEASGVDPAEGDGVCRLDRANCEPGRKSHAALVPRQVAGHKIRPVTKGVDGWARRRRCSVSRSGWGCGGKAPTERKSEGGWVGRAALRGIPASTEAPCARSSGMGVWGATPPQQARDHHRSALTPALMGFDQQPGVSGRLVPDPPAGEHCLAPRPSDLQGETVPRLVRLGCPQHCWGVVPESTVPLGRRRTNPPGRNHQHEAEEVEHDDPVRGR